MNDLFVLYRDDASPEEVKKWAEQEREKIKIRQEEKEREALREKLTFEEGRPLTGKEEIPALSLPEAAKGPSTSVAREVTIAIILIIVAITFGKKLLALLKSKGK
ncbi:MAG: hypothetical protein JSV30_04955 [Candidatus Omnitrophota bacterium]|nr:MAG: hypothetical protein JSV30_04955 [Candidatus Omnitrophota bacterium]